MILCYITYKDSSFCRLINKSNKERNDKRSEYNKSKDGGGFGRPLVKNQDNISNNKSS